MDTRNLSVLLVDDEEMVLKSALFCLRSTGWKTTTAANAEQGLQLAVALQPDVVVCDLSMPGMSGAELIEQLRRHPKTAGAAIVLMSGCDMAGPLPVATFLLKPFGPVELRAAIDSALAVAPTK